MNSHGGISKFDHLQLKKDANAKHEAAEWQLEQELKEHPKHLEFVNLIFEALYHIHSHNQTTKQLLRDPNTEPEAINKWLGDPGRELKADNELKAIMQQLGDHCRELKENEQLRHGNNELKEINQQLRDRCRDLERIIQQQVCLFRKLEAKMEQPRHHNNEQEAIIQQQSDHCRKLEADKEQLMHHNDELKAINQQLRDLIRKPKVDNQQWLDGIPFTRKHLLFKEVIKQGKTKKHTVIVVSKQDYPHYFSKDNRFHLRDKMFITKKLLYVICLELDENDQPNVVFNGPAYIKFATDKAEQEVMHLDNWFPECDETRVDSIVLKNCPPPYNEKIENVNMVGFFNDILGVPIDENCIETSGYAKIIKIKFHENSERVKVLKAQNKLANTNTYIDVYLTEYRQIQRKILSNFQIDHSYDYNGNMYVNIGGKKEHVDTLGRAFEIATQLTQGTSIRGWDGKAWNVALTVDVQHTRATFHFSSSISKAKCLFGSIFL